MRDRITIDGKRVGAPRPPKYYVVYKPRGVVTTTRDERARRTVLDLVPCRERLFPVGRLDAQSEGLLLLTNNGPLAQILLHPSFGVLRTYRVSVEGRIRAASLRKLTDGIMLGSRKIAVRDAQLLDRSPERSVIRLELVEGRRRQIREMLHAVGHPVRRLVRVGFGPLSLGNLRPAEWRALRAGEARAIQRMVAQGQVQGSGSSARNRSSKKA
jgi:23S rRNA pseudouridine2605 synthase